MRAKDYTLIKVTPRDIAASLRRQNRSFENYEKVSVNCPVARAICRQLKKPLGSVSVGRFHVGIDNTQSIPLSRSASRFIRSFDRERSVQPFNFKLEKV